MSFRKQKWILWRLVYDSWKMLQAAQEFINILTYCSNSHYKNSTIYVIKYIKYLEQSISQAIIFHGRLGHCSPNIALFLLPLWTLAMWLTLTNGLIEKNVRRGLKCTCIFGLGLFSSAFARRRTYPQKPSGSRRMINTRNRPKPNPCSRIDESHRSNKLQSNHRHKSLKWVWFVCHFF